MLEWLMIGFSSVINAKKNPCFSDIPHELLRFFCSTADKTQLGSLLELKQGNKNLIAFFVDGLGWDVFEQLKEHFPFLDDCLKKKSIIPLRAQFPSTTSAEVTTLYTGVPVELSGVWEWYFYHPKVHKIVSPLLYTYARDMSAGSLLENLNLSELFPRPRILEQIQNVYKYVIQPEEFYDSLVSRHLISGALRLGYRDMDDLFQKIIIATQVQNFPFLAIGYFGLADSLSHKYGPYSKEVWQVWLKFFAKLEQFISRQWSDTQLWLFSDHGHLPISHSKTIELNLLYPQLEQLVAKDSLGLPLAPAGSCRDFFLYLNPNVDVDEVKRQLQTKLEGRAFVADLEDLMNQDVWRYEPSELARARFPHLCICPYENWNVWWKNEQIPLVHRGYHGGLSDIELLTPFLSLSL